MKGDEECSGTFGEDLLSILALKKMNSQSNQNKAISRYLMCVGLSTEGGIGEWDFLENWNGVQKLNGYLGCVGLTDQTEGGKYYLDAFYKCVPTNTSINSQIVCSIEGHYGHHLPDYLKSRGVASKDLFVNGFMSIAWFFDFEKVCQYRMFLDGILFLYLSLLLID